VWQYNSEPDPNLGGVAPNLWQGRVFGGGSAVNAMVYCRGSSSVFDEWAEISGNTGLAWNSLLDDFKATSHYTYQPANYTQVVNTSVYGTGPLEVSRSSFLTGFDIPFANAMQSELGLQQVDMTDGTGIGVELGLDTIRVSNRTRSYALNTFGWLMGNRPNVNLISNAWVQRIGFSKSTARNVTYINTVTNKTSTISADEVIVSAGAINTPKLLMLSGVGPKDALSALHIPVVANIPAIGSNLYDHHYSAIEFQVTDNITTVWQWSENVTEAAIAEQQYASDASGPLGINNGATYGAFRLPDSVFEGLNDTFYTSIPSDRPHVLFEFGTTRFPFINTPNISIVATWATLVQPEATGYLTINSTNYQDPPVIHSNFYGSPNDKAAIMFAYKKLRSLLQSSFTKPYIVQEIFPGEDVTTDAEIWAAIQQSAESFHHPVGTVALGTVLDSNWRIKGLKNIRVVDSSAIPTPPTCHPQADVYAIAHRAARDIARVDGIAI
jgi:choline dehydrogenase